MGLPSLMQRVAFIHNYYRFPAKAMLLEAARGVRLLGIPFASPDNINHYFTESDEIPKCTGSSKQMVSDQQRKYQCNTKKKDIFTHRRGAYLYETTYNNQTDHFLFKSYRVYFYLMVLVDINSSCILVKLIKTKESKEM